MEWLEVFASFLVEMIGLSEHSKGRSWAMTLILGAAVYGILGWIAWDAAGNAWITGLCLLGALGVTVYLVRKHKSGWKTW